MAARNSTSSYKLQSLVTLLYRYQVISSGASPRHRYHMPRCNFRNGYGVDQGLRSIVATSGAYGPDQPKLNLVNNQTDQTAQPPSPSPSNPCFSNWVKWLLGSILPLLLSLWKKNCNSYCILEGKAQKVVEEVEDVAELVEKVAYTTDNALTNVASWLPDGSKLKEATLTAEHISSIAAKDAQCVENLIHKVEDLKQDFQDLRTLVEPVIDKIIDKK